MILATAYTPDDLYEAHVLGLATSVEQYAPFKLCAAQLKGGMTWRQACGTKPTVILDVMRRERCPVLWVDADARFRRPLDIPWRKLTRECDFAAWFIPNSRMRPRDVPCGASSGNDGIASGTMFWNYTPHAIKFLKLWRKAERGQGMYEQKVLAELWYTDAPAGFRTIRLPQSWCKVFDVPWFEQQPPEGPVIEHLQASRKINRAGIRRR